MSLDQLKLEAGRLESKLSSLQDDFRVAGGATYEHLEIEIEDTYSTLVEIRNTIRLRERGE